MQTKSKHSPAKPLGVNKRPTQPILHDNPKPSPSKEEDLVKVQEENKKAKHVISDEDYAAALMYEDDYISQNPGNAIEDPLDLPMPPEYKTEQLLQERRYPVPGINPFPYTKPALRHNMRGRGSAGYARTTGVRPQARLPPQVRPPLPHSESEEMKVAIEASLKDFEAGNKVTSIK